MKKIIYIISAVSLLVGCNKKANNSLTEVKPKVDFNRRIIKSVIGSGVNGLNGQWVSYSTSNLQYYPPNIGSIDLNLVTVTYTLVGVNSNIADTIISPKYSMGYYSEFVINDINSYEQLYTIASFTSSDSLAMNKLNPITINTINKDGLYIGIIQLDKNKSYEYVASSNGFTHLKGYDIYNPKIRLL